MPGACFGKAHHDHRASVQRKCVQADLETRVDAATAAAAAGLAHRCCISGECNPGYQWALLAPHD